LVAHQVPENSLEAAQAAKDLGFKFIEIDVKESSDGVFFLFHDRDGKRLLNKSQLVGIHSWSEIKEWPLYFDDKPSQVFIPSLDDFLKHYGNEFYVYFDIKRHGNDRYQNLADKWYDILQKNGLVDRAIIGSDFLFTSYLEYRYPDLHTVFTGPGDLGIRWYKAIPKNFRCDFIISYGAKVTSDHMQWIKQEGLLNRRMIYGVGVENYKDLQKLGVPKMVVDYHPAMQPSVSGDPL